MTFFEKNLMWKMIFWMKVIWKKVYKCFIYPTDSKLNRNKKIVNIDNGSIGGIYWTCFYKKDKKSLDFDSSGGAPDKVVLQQLPKLITEHSYKIPDINSRLCVTYCLIFYLIEGLVY